ncbi:hypothetical protein [Brevundimonas guildfordensis]|uniref:Uncharacterized protein n=1 Tax=Brevundimonas guildfordensis TaxID=2762241 RepID=A0ABR8QX54_9CAUL|nr:hypothetical protein [Brevundimonas guildfordensis]MBD7940116.1 hypothetical protein [Brevundimonas guildfordensis]
MVPLIGLGLDQRKLRNPWWFNAERGLLVNTEGVHHSKAFQSDPELLGLTHDDINFKAGWDARYIGHREQKEFYWAYPNLLLREGWVRIDVVEIGSEVTIIICAPKMSLVDDAINIARQKAHQTVHRLVVVVFPRTEVTSKMETQRIELSGAPLHTALRSGISSFARPDMLSGKEASHSKMRPSRCPFGFGGR